MEKVNFLELALLTSTRNLFSSFVRQWSLLLRNALEGLLNRVLGPPPEMLSQDVGAGLEHPRDTWDHTWSTAALGLSDWRLDLFLGGCTDESYALGAHLMCMGVNDWFWAVSAWL